MKILFVSSEIFPFAKSGGLGDVASSLPKALKNYSSITSIMPLYKSINREKHNIQSTGLVYEFLVNKIEYQFEVFQSGDVLFLDEKSGLFQRDEMYGDYEDNDIRFGIFCYGVLEYIRASSQYFDILHINDWQSALIALLEKEKYKLGSKVVFTIHNLAYQGIFSKESIERLDLSWDYFTASKIEYHDQINLLKSAIVYSDVFTTVSPTYAEEIQTHQFGCDLEQLIQDNEYKLKGILNGVDYDEFNPSLDTNLDKHFDADNLENKRAIKEDLLKEIHLEGIDKPLFVFIGRFTGQKGIDQILESLNTLASYPINIVILGSGEKNYNDWFHALLGLHKNLSITIGYDEALARRIYASSDFLYMPSQYEPCGLNQMIAMKYGAMPIVRPVGGLKDSVCDFDGEFSDEKGKGITLENGNAQTFINATNKALHLYLDKNRFDEIIQHNMRVDFSWDEKSKEYLSLFTDLKEGWLPERTIKKFEIPSYYNINTLKAMPVDPNTLYTYWEITTRLLNTHQLSVNQLLLKAYVEGIEVDSASIYDRVGSYYFYPEMDFKKVSTKIGFIGEYGTFISILESNVFIAPNAKVIKSANIIWRNITTDTLNTKRASFMSDTYYEVSDALSSTTILKRRQLQELAKDEQRNSSSVQLTRKEGA
jgi:starch synthase